MSSFDLKELLESLTGTPIETLDLIKDNGELNPFPVALALFTFLSLLSLTLLFWFFSTKLGNQKRSGKSLLLLGECGGGKTALFHRLLSPSQGLPQTLSSLKVNERQSDIKLGEENTQQNLHLVDIPGSGRLRKLSLFKFSPEARGIVFVVDSAQFSSQVRAVGEILREVLMDKNVQKRQVPVLVLCNKQDLLLSIRSDEIQKKLESELDSICQSHLAVPGEEEEEATQLVLPGEKFSFDNMESEVLFANSSVKSGDLKGVFDFVEQVFGN